MSKRKRDHRIPCSASSSEDDGSPYEGKRRREALLSYVAGEIKVIKEEIKDIKQGIRSLAEILQGIKEDFGHMNSQVAKPIGRAFSRCTGSGDHKNLQLHFKTRLSCPLFTERHIEGEKGAPICIELVDANTGHVVALEPEASIKLEVVVLEGDFQKDKGDYWTGEEFESYRIREREGRAPLLVGDLQVTLRGGVGFLGKLKFTDNSSWNRSKKYRIGLKVASGYYEGTRIREAITEAVRVKDHRGELYQKHYPAKPDDEVWRLKNIAKGGPYHKKLNKEGIFIVEDFLRHAVRDPKSLRNMLGGARTENKWQELMDHAKSCVESGKLYLYSLDTLGVVFDIVGQLNGFIADGSYCSADSLPHNLKEKLNSLVRTAYENWGRVKEFNRASYSTMNLESGIRSGSSALAAEGCNEVEGGRVMINQRNDCQMPPLHLGEVPVHQNLEPTEICSATSPFKGCSTSAPCFLEQKGSAENWPSAFLQDNNEMEAQMWDCDALWKLLEDMQSPILPPRCRSRTAAVSWLRIKAVLRWGFFRRKVTNKVSPIKVTDKGHPAIAQLNIVQ